MVGTKCDRLVACRRRRSQESDAVHFGRYTRRIELWLEIASKYLVVVQHVSRGCISPQCVDQPGCRRYLHRCDAVGRTALDAISGGWCGHLPRLAQLDADEAQRLRLTPLVTRWVTLLAFLGAAVAIVVGYPFIVVLYGVDYARAYLALVALLPGVVILSGSRIFGE